MVQRIKIGLVLDENGILRVDNNPSINEITLNCVLETIRRAKKILPKGSITGLSLSRNPSFNDSCLSQVISFMERQNSRSSQSNTIRGLYLEYLTNCSQHFLFKLCSSIQNFDSLLEISISGNNLPYFCIDALCNSVRLP